MIRFCRVIKTTSPIYNLSLTQGVLVLEFCRLSINTFNFIELI